MIIVYIDHMVSSTFVLVFRHADGTNLVPTQVQLWGWSLVKDLLSSYNGHRLPQALLLDLHFLW